MSDHRTAGRVLDVDSSAEQHELCSGVEGD